MNLTEIKGVGIKSEKLLNKLNIFSHNDLVMHYPYKYKFIYFSDKLIPSENIYLKVKITSSVSVSYIRRNLNILKFEASHNDKTFIVTIFNRAFLKQSLFKGKTVVIYGKYDDKKNTFTASDIINSTDEKIYPVYRLTKGINNNFLIKVINEVLESNPFFTDFVPSKVNEKYEFLEKLDALKKIHNPKSIKDIKAAKLKLIYEEFFVFFLKLAYLKEKNSLNSTSKKVFDEDKLNNFLKSLKFTPTSDQEKAFTDIKRDSQSSKKMNRLIMGDVGSGKTIVAVYAIYLNYLSGYQSTFMAPTEILAKQHYENIKALLPELKVSLLTGKLKLSESRKIKEDLKLGNIDLLIGTHALISESVVFKNLGLIVTDEQHRFGVAQRESLEKKGNNPDVVYLSATPIPRTYALVLYNDMDLSIIKEKPKNRKETVTKLVKEKDIKEVLLHIKSEVENKRQIFIVSALIDNEESDLKSVEKLKSSYKSAFKNSAIVDVIHGGMNSAEKDKVMEKFLDKKINILISTTVIEVGIDIPNASTIVIYNAERFGLSTLHQLRGRVGRGEEDSFCYLISDLENERLDAMVKSSDGFYITEVDFKTRKEGDIFGEEQSGESIFKIGSIERDIKILLQAYKDVSGGDYLKDEKYKIILKDI